MNHGPDGFDCLIRVVVRIVDDVGFKIVELIEVTIKSAEDIVFVTIPGIPEATTSENIGETRSEYDEVDRHVAEQDGIDQGVEVPPAHQGIDYDKIASGCVGSSSAADRLEHDLMLWFGAGHPAAQPSRL